jgi:hypothetical protein
MKKSLLLHTGWLLVAAAAYVVGSRQPSLTGSSAAMRGQSSVAATARGTDPSTVADAALGAAAAGSWLDTFRDSQGIISAERMNAALVEALKDPDPVKAMTAFTQLLAALTPENASAAYKAIRETTGGFESMRYLSLLGYAWGEKDGPAALKALGADGGRDGGWTKSTALAGWASSDPEGAINYLAELKASKTDDPNARGGGNRDDAMLERGLVSGLARKDIDAALKYVMGLKEDQRDNYMGVIAEQKLREGVNSASVWAMALTDPKMRAAALDTVSRQFLRQDPAAAAEWAKSIAGQPGTAQAVAVIVDAMARKNPAEAAAWVSNLPDGEGQRDALGQVFRDWTRSDPTAASTQLTQMPAGAAKNSAITAFTRSLARENPQDALTWTKEISDADQRLKAQADVARRWNDTNPKEAQPWIAANLPPDLQAVALAPRNGGPPGPAGADNAAPQNNRFTRGGVNATTGGGGSGGPTTGFRGGRGRGN